MGGMRVVLLILFQFYQAGYSQAPLTAYLLFARRDAILRVNLDGSGIQTIIGSNPLVTSAIAIDYDIRQNVMFWTDVSQNTITRANLDGSELTTLISEGLDVPDGLAWDWLNQKLYWTDAHHRTVEVLDPATMHRKQLLYIGMAASPRAIVVDPNRRWMYWTDWGNPAKIERASMDGTAREVLHNTSLIWPNALTIDFDTQVIYWADASLDKLEKSNVDGSNRMLLTTTNVFHPFGLTFFNNHVYWSDWDSDRLSSTMVSNPNSISYITGPLDNEPMGVHVVTESRQSINSNSSNPCAVNNGNCSHICLLSSTDPTGYSCMCPQGLELGSNQRDCIGGNATIATNTTQSVPTITETVTEPTNTQQVTTENHTQNITTKGPNSVCSAFLQLLIGSVHDCQEWRFNEPEAKVPNDINTLMKEVNQFNEPEAKVNDIINTLVKEVNQVCDRCMLTRQHIAEPEFSCTNMFSKSVVFRAHLETNDCSLVLASLNSWIKEGEASLLIHSNRLEINPSCDVQITSKNVKVTCNSASTTVTAPNATQTERGHVIEIAASISGILIPLVMSIVILMIAVLVFCTRNYRRKQGRYATNTDHVHTYGSPTFLEAVDSTTEPHPYLSPSVSSEPCHLNLQDNPYVYVEINSAPRVYFNQKNSVKKNQIQVHNSVEHDKINVIVDEDEHHYY